LIEGLNIVYAEREKRSWFRLTAAAIALTVAGLVSVIIFLASTLLLPKLLAHIGVNQTVLLSVISYLALALFLWLELCAIYRWAPNRAAERRSRTPNDPRFNDGCPEADGSEGRGNGGYRRQVGGGVFPRCCCDGEPHSIYKRRTGSGIGRLGRGHYPCLAPSLS
jgi:hypothetical protein